MIINELRNVVRELEKQTKVLKEIAGNQSNIEAAVYNSAPSN
ncbi:MULTISPECIES: hypothetical protein [unclassified Frondihabitans]|nr:MULTISPECIES: hypothetical protein [unclassified Frondihabitans]